MLVMVLLQSLKHKKKQGKQQIKRSFMADMLLTVLNILQKE